MLPQLHTRRRVALLGLDMHVLAAANPPNVVDWAAF